MVKRSKSWLSTEVGVQWVLGLLLAMGAKYYLDGRDAGLREMDMLERRIATLENRSTPCSP